MGNRWIGVDLDGTLAHYSTWDKQGQNIGEPVAEMMKRVREWINDGKTVKIFTARASEPENIRRVEAWLIENDLGGLEITNIKDFDMSELWDDRAVRVERNTGRILQGIPVRIWKPTRRRF